MGRTVIQRSRDLVAIADKVSGVGLQVEDPLHTGRVIPEVVAVISA